jgi:hypothetical protein
LEWTGLIYAEDNIRCTGTMSVVGAVLAAGSSGVSVDFGLGTPSILYSREALVQTLTLAMDYIVLSWKEI